MYKITTRYLILARFFSILIFLFFNNSVFAVPQHVYRAVFRDPAGSPEQVFKFGFNSWGNNNNLAAHIRGDSTGSNGRMGNSGFISTAGSMEYLNTLASDRAIPESIYLYEIRADHNFYSVDVSLNAMPNRLEIENTYGISFHIPTTVPPDYQSPDIGIDLPPPQEDEYVTRGFIPGSNIINVVEADYDFTQQRYIINERTRRNNEYYIPLDTQANTEPYQPIVFDSITVFNASVNSTAACSSTSSSSRLKRSVKRSVKGSKCYVSLGFCPVNTNQLSYPRGCITEPIKPFLGGTLPSLPDNREGTYAIIDRNSIKVKLSPPEGDKVIPVSFAFDNISQPANKFSIFVGPPGIEVITINPESDTEYLIKGIPHDGKIHTLTFTFQSWFAPNPYTNSIKKVYVSLPN